MRLIYTERPFEKPHGCISDSWTDIAKMLSKLYSKDLAGLTGRGAQDKFKALLQKFKAQETLSKKASGVDEPELSEKQVLLTDLVALVETEEEKESKKKKKDKKEKEDTQQIGKKIREAALSGLKRKHSTSELVDFASANASQGIMMLFCSFI